MQKNPIGYGFELMKSGHSKVKVRKKKKKRCLLSHVGGVLVKQWQCCVSRQTDCCRQKDRDMDKWQKWTHEGKQEERKLKLHKHMKATLRKWKKVVFIIKYFWNLMSNLIWLMFADYKCISWRGYNLKQEINLNEMDCKKKNQEKDIIKKRQERV